jgi:hypothetical protein
VAALPPDREPAVGVEEVHVPGIHPELDPVAGANAAARVDPRGPQGLALAQRHRRLVFLILRAKVGDVLVLQRVRRGRDALGTAAAILRGAEILGA